MPKKPTSVKSASKPASSTNISTPSAKVTTGVMSIELDNDAIQKLAFEISQQPKSYDDFVWMFAEAELRLKPAYAVNNVFQTAGPVQIYPAKIVDKPNESEIRSLAAQIASQGTSMQDLHWFAAQRIYVYNKAKGKK